MNQKFEQCGICYGEEGHINTDGDWIDCWNCGGMGGWVVDDDPLRRAHTERSKFNADPTAPNYEKDEEAA